MKQSIFSLADLITVLTAVSFGYVCFLSINFYTLGDINQSLILSGIITLVLGALAFTAKLLKRTNQNFKNCFIIEVVVLILFTFLTAFFTYSPFSHYFTVLDSKREIQIKLSNNITQAENMFYDYEVYAENRKQNYKANLESVAKNAEGDPVSFALLFNNSSGISTDKQIQYKLITIHSDLFPSNFTDSLSNKGIKEVASNWLSNAQKSTRDWKPIGIVNVVNEVGQNSKNWLSDLTNISKIQIDGEGPDIHSFDINLSFEDIKSYFTKRSAPKPLSIVFAMLAYLLMLLPWYITKRSRKFHSGGLASYEVEL